jgi:hypothetical protein
MRAPIQVAALRHPSQTIRPSLALLCLFAVSLLWSGCSYDSSLGAVSCTEENRRSEGRVCKDGLWIDEGGLDVYTGDVTDVAPDTAPDTAPDATPDTDTDDCLQGQIRCNGSCVDTQTNADHCGACGQTCYTFGDNSIAMCQQGSCERTCDEGWTDADQDWNNTDDPQSSNGCELECTPTEDPTEVCDGVDNNCDGQIDEGVTTRYYLDADGDDYGVTTDFEDLCAPTGDHVATDDGDCNDENDQVHPTAEDICNGVDDDCDDDIDPGCSCVNGATMDCYSGTPSTEDVGLCQGGTATCTEGSWGSCAGEVTPQAEVCDGADNDCDGDNDEGVLNTYFEDSDGDTFGDASSTTQACSVPQDYVQNDDDCVDSEASINPGATEVCNGVDDDCDNDTDEGFDDKGDACTVGVGICEQTGTLVCTGDGSGTECSVSAGTPDGDETCGDSLDNDCNGLVDDGCPCDFNGQSAGVCGTATLVELGNCAEPAGYENDETLCDGVDNDCDGDDDEGVTTTYQADADGDNYGDPADTIEACTQPAGYIQPRVDGREDCDDGDPWTYPNAPEICDDKDNDCSGGENDASDDENDAASQWCASHFTDPDPSDPFTCDSDGPGGEACCEEWGDPSDDCENETICHNGVDEDEDGDTDCADSDCDGLSCGAGMLCQSGSCQAI